MQTIYKYEIKVAGLQTIKTDRTAVALDVQLQKNKICIWMLCDPSDKEEVDKKIYMYGTGHEINYPHLQYVGTVQQDGLVWHIFED